METQVVQLVLLCIVSTCWGQQASLTWGLVNITNNTEIPITSIGEYAYGDLPPLTCHTDLTTCCRSFAENNGQGGLGQWRYPDGSVLLNNKDSADAGQQFYRIRNAPQVIRLRRKGAYNPLTPTGSYCCTIPTSGGNMTLCVNLVAPICSDNLPAISNGGIAYAGGSTNNRPVGATASYNCFNPYTLIGVSVRTCGSDGEWNSTTAPACEQICSDLPLLANGDIMYGGTGSMNSKLVGTVTTYNCNPGYTLNGDTTRTCESDRTWSGSAPTCQPITCSDLPTLIVSYNGGSPNIRPVNTGATYSCNSGYAPPLPENTITRVCTNEGIWSGSAPTCQVTCPDLLVPVNGMISYSSSTSPHPQGTTATQSCLNGYVPSTTTRMCIADRSWGGSDLTCQLPPVYVSVGSTNYTAMNSQVDINTIGVADDQAIICRTDNAQCCRGRNGLGAGEWRFPSGEVVPRRIDVNVSVPFVSSYDTGILRLHRRGSVSGPTGSYCCVIPDSTGVNTTFCVQLLVPEVTTISAAIVTTTSVFSCGPPPSIDNGYSGQPTNTMIGGEATYTCDTGFIFSGSSIATCLSTGSWSNPPFCQTPPPVYLSLASTNHLSGLSEIPLSSVGEGCSLVCHTDLAGCCERNTGDWYYPNGSVVMEDGALYASRGQMSVSLMMSGTATAPGGVYCCVVPTSGGIDTACIVLSAMQSTQSITASTDESSPSPCQCDNTGAVVGGAVALVAVVTIVTGVVMVTYLVLRYKRGGKMTVTQDISLTDQGQSAAATYETVPAVYDEIPASKNVKGDYVFSQNNAYSTVSGRL